MEMKIDWVTGREILPDGTLKSVGQKAEPQKGSSEHSFGGQAPKKKLPARERKEGWFGQ